MPRLLSNTAPIQSIHTPYTQVLNKLPFLPKRERVIRIVTYAVPVAPGRSKVMYRFLRNYFLPPKPLRCASHPSSVYLID